MSLLRKDFPGRHAVILLIIAIMLILIEVMDELYLETNPWVDFIYAVPIITAAILLSPLETIGVGLLGTILCLTTQIESTDIEHLNMLTSAAVGIGGVVAAGSASLIRRSISKIKTSREALNNSPLAYAEFKFPGYGIVSHNDAFRQFVEMAGGKVSKSLFDSLPGKITENIAGKMNESVMGKKRVDCDELLLPTAEGKNSFWRTNFIPLPVGSKKTPRSVAMFAFNVTASVQRAHTHVAALKISSAVMSSLDLDNTIRVVLDNMAYIAETSAAALFLFEDDQWVGTAGYGDYSDKLIMSMRYPYEELAAAVEAVESKKALAVTSPREISRSYQEMFNKLNAKSYLVVPLVSGNRTIGSVWLKHDDSKRRFSKEQIEFATAIGSHAALAIENATIYENEHFIRKAMEAIEAISEAGLVSLDLEEVLMEIVNRTQDVMRMDSALIFLVDNKREYLVPRAVTGAMREYASQIRVPVGKGIVGRTFKEGVPMKIDNLLNDEEEGSFFAETDIHSVLTVPLRIGGKVEGVLEIGCHRENAFSTR
ncbi:MAG: GAF domain-containing protein [Thermoleophilia bacterium]